MWSLATTAIRGYTVPSQQTKRTLLYQARCLIGAVRPLLALFSELDDVFTEDEALTTYKQVSLGRCYEAWQRCREAFDPDFKAADYRRPRGRKRGISGRT